MRYHIAIDSGGSKTDTVLFDETGRILYRDLNLGCNAIDLGKERATARLLKILQFVCSRSPGRVDVIHAGIASGGQFGDYMLSVLDKELDVGTIHIGGDGPNIISGALGQEDGCCMVGGTGSSLFVRIKGEPLRRIGGKGYLIDTGGGGFNLGSEAFCMALRAVDGRCKHTVLVELLSEKLGMPVEACMPAVYGHPAGPRAFLASFAPVVFEGRKLGDWACEEIFQRGSWLLADLTHAAARYFPGEFKVIMNGGLFTHFPEYVQAVREKASPNAKLALSDVPPVYGAAVEAMWKSGLPVTDGFRTQFLADYKAWESRDLPTEISCV